MESIISAILAGAVTLIGVLIANSRSQAVTDTKLEELTREVREHNNFARRVPILEEQMKVANHRTPELLTRDWYVDVDVSKYAAYFVVALNHDMSVSSIIDPLKKIEALLASRK